MKIAIDIRETIHEKTGKGYYAVHLVDALLKLDKANQYLLYSSEPIKTFENYKNAQNLVINQSGIRWHYKTLKDLYNEQVDLFFAPTSYIIPALHNPKKLKVILTVHDLVAFLFPQKHNKKAVFIERLFLKRALKKVRRIFAVSENTKKDLISRFKISSERIDIIHNAASDIFQKVNKEELDFFKAEQNIPNNFILATGTLEPRKNYPLLIQAFSKILKKFPQYKLLITGKKGWYFNVIFKTVEKLQLEDKVEFLGYVPERNLVKLYNLATIFVYPSLYEGFGVPPLEAMKSGCPVITSNSSSLPEVVNEAAILVDPHNEHELVEALEKMISSKELQEEYRQKGFAQAQKFSWDESAQKALQIFKKLD